MFASGLREKGLVDAFKDADAQWTGFGNDGADASVTLINLLENVVMRNT
jgi:hypothetical protein